MALYSRKTLKNTFLTMRSFSVLFSLQFDEGYTMVGLKIFKPCINIRFVSIVYRSVAQPRF